VGVFVIRQLYACVRERERERELRWRKTVREIKRVRKTVERERERKKDC
jgi:hypothetical protein